MQDTLPLMGQDTETHRIGPCQQLPPLVCISVAAFNDQAQMMTDVAGMADDQKMEEFINLFMSDQFIHVLHNAAYDYGVLCAFRPSLFPQVFNLYERGLIRCTRVREKLLNLTSHGSLKFYPSSDGEAGRRIEYSLSDLVKTYMDKDISAEKTKTGKDGAVIGGVSDSWRLNFQMLESVPTPQWPQDAIQYAADDSIYALYCHCGQEAKRDGMMATAGIDPFAVQNFRCMLDFCLILMSAWGIAVDPAAKGEIEAMLAKELAPERLTHLIQSGVLRPGSPPQPNKLGHKEHVPNCRKKWKESGAVVECTCPIKMTQAIEPSVNETLLREYITKLAESNTEIVLKRTNSSKKFPNGQLSLTDEFFEQYAHIDPVFEQMHHRGALSKLVTTELPRMNWMGQTAPIVHPQYDVLKETGRTSSFGSDTLPSINIQNVDPRTRGCYIPRPGNLLWSADYQSMELGTLAQKCLHLFGKSVLAEKINAGVDVHAFLGAQIAYHLNQQFRAACANQNAVDPDSILACFMATKGHAVPEVAELFKHFRKLAKPTGLGYPGGLGPKTFVAYCKAAYGEIVDLELATTLRDIWRQTYPEMPAYFEWINTQCIDPRNPPRISVDPVTGQEKTSNRYAYLSPLGMYRASCDYCSAANGAGMQTPGAEGEKLALINVIRACYDPSLCSILIDSSYGPPTRVIGDIHDELLGEVADNEYAHDRVCEIARIMEEAFRIITPDVRVKAQPVLMRRWSKDAEPVFDPKTKRLIPWTPKSK